MMSYEEKILDGLTMRGARKILDAYKEPGIAEDPDVAGALEKMKYDYGIAVHCREPHADAPGYLIDSATRLIDARRSAKERNAK